MISTTSIATLAIAVFAAAVPNIPAGSAAGTSSASGQGQSLFRATGSAAGVSTAAGQNPNTGAPTSVGSPGGIATFAIAAPVISQAVQTYLGSAAGTSSAQGEGRALFQAIGTAAGTSNAAGQSGLPAVYLGTAAGTSDAQGEGRALVRGTGSAAGTSSVQGEGASTSPFSIRADIQKLAPGQLIEMFELDISTITGSNTPADHYYFHSGTNESFGSIVWQGHTYERFPIEGEGFDKLARGTSPRPRLRAANVTGIISALLLATDDLVGARVIRRRTYARFLDGQPGADPNQFLPDDIFYVEKKVTENKSVVEWELATALDLEGMMLPSRVIAANTCVWDYRSSECSYTGSAYFDIFNNPVGTLAQDICSKSVVGCKRRFGATGLLPFGGFPAARVYKV